MGNNPSEGDMSLYFAIIENDKLIKNLNLILKKELGILFMIMRKTVFYYFRVIFLFGVLEITLKYLILIIFCFKISKAATSI